MLPPPPLTHTRCSRRRVTVRHRHTLVPPAVHSGSSPPPYTPLSPALLSQQRSPPPVAELVEQGQAAAPTARHPAAAVYEARPCHPPAAPAPAPATATSPQPAGAAPEVRPSFSQCVSLPRRLTGGVEASSDGGGG